MRTYLGTWQTAPSDGFWTDQSLRDSENVISRAVRLGVRCFDTAQSYGKGRSEQTLAKILRRFPDLSFTVDTKIMPSSKSPEELLEISLERLKPLTVDCLYLHWPRSGFDNLDFLRKMDYLKEKKLIGKLGVCNIPLKDLRQFVRSGLKIDRIQRPVSLLWTRELDETLAFCRENNMELAAYSPTGMGLLSGKYRNAQDLRDGRSKLFCFNEKCLKAYHNLLDLVARTAENNGLTSTDVSRIWTENTNSDIIILGARNTDQLEQNLRKKLKLSSSELSDLSVAAKELDRSSMDVCENIFSYNW
ncbi:MAG: aldo/keto reductase [Spirochaetales bacterium]|nr:aldo/keto reductase [Spirochaetales bacterium]